MKWNHTYDGISFTVSDNAITYGREGDDRECVTLYDGMGVAIMDGVESAYQHGRAEALDAAEAAVNEVLDRTPNAMNGEYITVSKHFPADLIAAIRALKEKP